MTQLVGQRCIKCAKVIHSTLEGAFCLLCKKALHHACLSPDTLPATRQHCPKCGGDPSVKLASDFGLGKASERSNHFEIEDPVLGGLIRKYPADFWHTTIFYLMALALALSGPVCLVAGVDQGFCLIWTCIGVVGGSLIAFAGWCNSRNTLELYERGIRVKSLGRRQECAYSAIGDVLLTKELYRGAEIATGILIPLHNGQVWEAKVISGARSARQEILLKLKGAEPRAAATEGGVSRSPSM